MDPGEELGALPATNLRDAIVPRVRLWPQRLQPRRRRDPDRVHRQRVLPRGHSGYDINAGSLKFEQGPTTDIRLEWATYYDASDQAGQSRLYGGIHVQADDFTGRRLGSQCGKDAWALAQRYYAGTTGPVS